MANPSQKAIDLIRANVADWNLTDSQIVNVLNTPDRPNPVPAKLIPKPMDSVNLLSKIDGPAKGKIYARPAILGLQGDIKSGDRNAVKNWFALAVNSGDITQPQYSALVGELDSTIPDPNWKDQISWSIEKLGRLVDVNDIAESRKER